MGAIASQITSLTIVYSIVYSDADQRKYQSSASLAFVQGIHRGPVNSPHKWPVTRRKMFPFGDVIMHYFCIYIPRPSRGNMDFHGFEMCLFFRFTQQLSIYAQYTLNGKWNVYLPALAVTSWHSSMIYDQYIRGIMSVVIRGPFHTHWLSS